MDRRVYGPIGLPESFHQIDWPFLREQGYSYDEALGASSLLAKSGLGAIAALRVGKEKNDGLESDDLITKRNSFLKLCSDLMASQNKGHLCLLLSPEAAAGEAESLLLESGICAIGSNGTDSPAPLVLVSHNDRLLLYTRAFYNFESRFLRLVSAHSNRAQTTAVPELIAELEAWIGSLPENLRPDAYQRQAVFGCLSHTLFILTGGPGTGKTTTVFHMLRALWHEAQPRTEHLRIALAAPTGRAARRMEESLMSSLERCSDYMQNQTDKDFANALRLLKGHTLHRLTGTRASFGRVSDGNPRLPYDVVVVDEASMIDVVLMSRLLEGLDPKTRLILVGDHRQLPSIEAGAILGDLVEGENLAVDIGVTKLTKTFRFGGDLAKTATLVLEGRGRELIENLSTAPVGSSVSLRLYPGGSHMTQLREGLLQQYLSRTGANGQSFLTAFRLCDFSTGNTTVNSDADEEELDREIAGIFESLSSRILLSAFRSGFWGVESINKRIIECVLLSRGQRAPSWDTQIWLPGMPVMAVKNDYERGLFNGDRGIIYRSVQGQLRAWFPAAGSDGRPVRFAPQTIAGLEPAYAITIHKSQGSEFDEVTLVLNDSQAAGSDRESSLTRELVYTAITRARKTLHIISDLESLVEGCVRQTHRDSLIGAFLEGSYRPG